jgi:hypothetical protein
MSRSQLKFWALRFRLDDREITVRFPAEKNISLFFTFSKLALTFYPVGAKENFSGIKAVGT